MIMKARMIKMLAGIAMIACAECKAQWTSVYQDSYTQFYDAAFPTDYTGYVAASDTGGAVILRTNDGGATWNKRYIPGLSFINKITMIDSLTGYIIAGGVPVKLIKTTDGFATLSGHTLDSSFIVQALCPLNDSTGFYLNNGARLRKFENNGANYAHIVDTLFGGQNLQFVSAVTGYFDTGTGLLKTTDAGTSWNAINANMGFPCVTFRFADSLHGYFSDFSDILMTHNGGITFPQLYHFSRVYSIAAQGNFCIAANDTGNVAYSANGGSSWQTETTGINWVAAEPYKVFISPGGYCFLFSEFSEEIRKRELFTMGMADVPGDAAFSIYPNPFADGATLYFEEEQNHVTISIIDLLGKVARTENFTGKQLAIEKRELQAGIYFVQVMGEKGNITSTKIIIR